MPLLNLIISIATSALEAHKLKFYSGAPNEDIVQNHLT